MSTNKPRGRKADQLTAKEERFCLQYIIHLNASKAAQEAGYSKKTSGIIGFENLNKPKIKERIAELQHQAMLRAELSADMVINELRAMGFYSIKDFISTGNEINDLSQMERDLLKPVLGIKVTERYDPEGNPITTTELKMVDKRAALVDLGKHLGIFKEDNQQKAIKIKVVRK